MMAVGPAGFMASPKPAATPVTLSSPTLGKLCDHCAAPFEKGSRKVWASPSRCYCSQACLTKDQRNPALS